MGEKVDMHVGPLTRASTIVAAVLIVMTFPTWAAADGPQRHAVVIGINDYADKAIPDLKYAEADARAVHGTLIDPAVGRFPKENVRLILGPQASNDNIKAALYALRRVGKDDLVVIYFSGHGAKEGEQAFWVTQAAQRRALPVTSLRNKEIRELLAKIPSQRMTAATRRVRSRSLSTTRRSCSATSPARAGRPLPEPQRARRPWSTRTRSRASSPTSSSQACAARPTGTKTAQ